MSSDHGHWLAGAAVIPFLTVVGTPLAGYAARTGPAEGIHDELTIGAVVLQWGNRRLAIVAADVVAVDAALAAEIAAAAGLNRSEVVLCASHTHSGPAGVVSRLHPAEPDRLNPGLRATFVLACTTAIESALARLEQVEVLVGVAETAGAAANRNDPTGSYDPRLSVLATRRLDGPLGAILVHFACHPTVLGAQNRLVSADFPGAIRRELGATLARNDNAPAVLFVNGAAGDVSTRFTRLRQDFAEVQRVGRALAGVAVRALAGAQAISGPIRYRRLTVPLPPRPREEIDATMAAAAATRPDAEGEITAADRRLDETRSQGAALLGRLAEAGLGAKPAALDAEVWALGDLRLVAVPGELFAALGQRIVARSPLTTLVLGYANGYVGYLADEPAYGAGTYEALASPFGPGAGERVVDAISTALAGQLEGDRIADDGSHAPPGA